MIHFLALYSKLREIKCLTYIGTEGGAREALDELGLDDLPPLERLCRFLERSYEGQVRCFKENGRVLGCLLGNLALELSTQDDDGGGRLRELFDAHVDRFERVISEAAARGEVETQDPGRTARALMALIEGGVMFVRFVAKAPLPSTPAGQDARRTEDPA